jgi:8-oxo-dGTP pyrophosphatase MutT (NUDIX family)
LTPNFVCLFAKMVRMVHRRKVLVIPYINDKVLMVKDALHKEWGFISGGVKQREHPIRAAERELYEETSGLFNNIPNKEMTFFTFQTNHRPPELLEKDEHRGEQVSSTYYVYIFHIHDDNTTTFRPNKEVDALSIDRYSNFTNRWEFCDNIVVPELREVLDFKLLW